MSSVAIGLIVFACVFGGALLGIFLRGVLPAHHLSAGSKDIVRLGMGLGGNDGGPGSGPAGGLG